MKYLHLDTTLDETIRMIRIKMFRFLSSAGLRTTTSLDNIYSSSDLVPVFATHFIVLVVRIR